MDNTLAHLSALRQVFMRAVLGYAVIAVIAALCAKPLFTVFAAPIMALLPSGSLIATGIATPFLVPLTFSLMFALCIAMPWILYQGWLFIAPGLFVHEKKRILLLTSFSFILFYTGIGFAYFFVIPLALDFFVHAAPVGVTVLTDVDAYFGFAIKLMIAFGLAFQVPLVVMALVKSGAVTRESLMAKRPYVIIACFVLGMLLTPPDVFSQTLLAVPMWMLFELGLFLTKKDL
ncbi:MAG: twin-arginine translocase subunit TatC [Gammaproteobacteria bacterium]